jgi:hypothetical protein
VDTPLEKVPQVKNRIKSYFFNHLNTLNEIHTEIDEGPNDTFFLVFFLFQDEHVMVKELLQFLIGEVDANLFETVVLKCTG